MIQVRCEATAPSYSTAGCSAGTPWTNRRPAQPVSNSSGPFSMSHQIIVTREQIASLVRTQWVPLVGMLVACHAQTMSKCSTGAKCEIQNTALIVPGHHHQSESSLSAFGRDIIHAHQDAIVESSRSLVMTVCSHRRSETAHPYVYTADPAGCPSNSTRLGCLHIAKACCCLRNFRSQHDGPTFIAYRAIEPSEEAPPARHDFSWSFSRLSLILDRPLKAVPDCH